MSSPPFTSPSSSDFLAGAKGAVGGKAGKKGAAGAAAAAAAGAAGGKKGEDMSRTTHDTTIVILHEQVPSQRVVVLLAHTGRSLERREAS